MVQRKFEPSYSTSDFIGLLAGELVGVQHSWLRIWIWEIGTIGNGSVTAEIFGQCAIRLG